MRGNAVSDEPVRRIGENTIVTSALALGIVLVLIVLGLWALKFVTRTGTVVGRGRNRRLSVVDTVQLDAKRQLLIIRRDNVEHLILTGGPQDVRRGGWHPGRASRRPCRPQPPRRSRKLPPPPAPDG